jgi:hypothetical protein
MIFPRFQIFYLFIITFIEYLQLLNKNKQTTNKCIPNSQIIALKLSQTNPSAVLVCRPIIIGNYDRIYYVLYSINSI